MVWRPPWMACWAFCWGPLPLGWLPGRQGGVVFLGRGWLPPSSIFPGTVVSALDSPVSMPLT